MADYIVCFEGTRYTRRASGEEVAVIERVYVYQQRRHCQRQRVGGRTIRAGEWGFTNVMRRADRFPSVAAARRAIEGTRLYQCLVPDADGKVLIRGGVQRGSRVITASYRMTVHIRRQTRSTGWLDCQLITSAEVWPQGQAVDALAALA